VPSLVPTDRERDGHDAAAAVDLNVAEELVAVGGGSVRAAPGANGTRLRQAACGGSTAQAFRLVERP
jgi:hypothetical protein